MDKDSHSLKAGIFLFSLLSSALLYALFSACYGSLNPTHWRYADSLVFWMLAFPLPLVFGANYFSSKHDLEFDDLVARFFDFDMYISSKLKFADIILNHYTNVATVGLLLMVLIYMVRPYVMQLPGIVLGASAALMFMIIFFVYSLFVVRLTRGLFQEPKLRNLLMVYAIVFIDFKALGIFIRSVPNA